MLLFSADFRFAQAADHAERLHDHHLGYELLAGAAQELPAHGQVAPVKASLGTKQKLLVRSFAVVGVIPSPAVALERTQSPCDYVFRRAT